MAGASHAAYPPQLPRQMYPPDGCTTIVSDPSTSNEGVGMTTHTNDCHECDPRIVKVPAQDFPPNSLRPIFAYRSAYPRYVGNYYNADPYKPENTDMRAFQWKETQPIGYIPQVSHTYAFIDGTYAIQNEWQVGIGESTCAARIVAAPRFDGGHALMDVASLTRIGLERGKTAREVVMIMGDMATTYGFYGEAWTGDMAEGEAGETLTVVDPNEAFVFHVLADSTGKSAIWVAQKVPKGHVAVCSNAFIIKEVDFNDPINFLYSANILSDALKLGFYDPSYGPFHFTHTYGLVTTFDTYCSRRAWRVLSVMAPNLKLQPTDNIAAMPFSVKPDRLINQTDLMWLQRDHFEGTEYDTTQGLAAGPYGNPTRYDPSAYFNTSRAVLFQGHFERTISIHRTSYSFVVEARPSLPTRLLTRMWFGSSIPHATYYQPVYVFASSPPPSLSIGSLHFVDRRSTFWAATILEGWMEKCYRLISVDVAIAQRDLEQLQLQKVTELEARALELVSQSSSSRLDVDVKSVSGVELVKLLSDFSQDNGNAALQTWWSLFDTLVVKFHDGFRIDNIHVETLIPQPVFYPLPWLKAVGYFNPGGPDLTATSWQYAHHEATRPPPHASAPPLPFAATQSITSIKDAQKGNGVVVAQNMNLNAADQTDVLKTATTWCEPGTFTFNMNVIILITLTAAFFADRKSVV